MSWTKGLETLIETMEKKYSQEEKVIASRAANIAHVVKPAKVPTWTKDMSVKTFWRQLRFGKLVVVMSWRVLSFKI